MREPMRVALYDHVATEQRRLVADMLTVAVELTDGIARIQEVSPLPELTEQDREDFVEFSLETIDHELRRGEKKWWQNSDTEPEYSKVVRIANIIGDVMGSEVFGMPMASEPNREWMRKLGARFEACNFGPYYGSRFMSGAAALERAKHSGMQSGNDGIIG